jgi:hypothetical protein
MERLIMMQQLPDLDDLGGGGAFIPTVNIDDDPVNYGAFRKSAERVTALEDWCRD